MVPSGGPPYASFSRNDECRNHWKSGVVASLLLVVMASNLYNSDGLQPSSFLLLESPQDSKVSTISKSLDVFVLFRVSIDSHSYHCLVLCYKKHLIEFPA